MAWLIQLLWLKNVDKNITYLGGPSLPGASIPILFQDSKI